MQQRDIWHILQRERGFISDIYNSLVILVTTNLFAENHDLYVTVLNVNTDLLKIKINNDDLLMRKKKKSFQIERK